MKAIDPVCGITVDTASAAATAEHNGQAYYFCAPSCKANYLKEKERLT